MQSPSQHQSNHNFQNSYFRFMYAIKSPETKKRYPDRFKAFLDYIQIPGNDIEERLVDFYNEAKQNLPWLQKSLINFIIFQKERVLNGEIAASTISNYYKPIKLFCDLNDILINWEFISILISICYRTLINR
jgi:hypothetical protein